MSETTGHYDPLQWTVLPYVGTALPRPCPTEYRSITVPNADTEIKITDGQGKRLVKMRLPADTTDADKAALWVVLSRIYQVDVAWFMEGCK